MNVPIESSNIHNALSRTTDSNGLILTKPKQDLK